MQLKDWNIEALTGYKPKTTFYLDFSAAEIFGPRAIRDTYRRAMDEWCDNVQYLTELVMVLNWKIWEHHELRPEYAELYQELWERADTFAMDSLSDDDLTYFLETTD